MGFENGNSQLTHTVSQTLSSQATPDLVVKRNLQKFSLELGKRSFYSNEFSLSNHINEASMSSRAAVRTVQKLPENNSQQKYFSPTKVAAEQLVARNLQPIALKQKLVLQ